MWLELEHFEPVRIDFRRRGLCCVRDRVDGRVVEGVRRGGCFRGGRGASWRVVVHGSSAREGAVPVAVPSL